MRRYALKGIACATAQMYHICGLRDRRAVAGKDSERESLVGFKGQATFLVLPSAPNHPTYNGTTTIDGRAGRCGPGSSK